MMTLGVMRGQGVGRGGEAQASAGSSSQPVSLLSPLNIVMRALTRVTSVASVASVARLLAPRGSVE